MKRNPEDSKPDVNRAQILKMVRQSKNFSKITDDQLMYVTDPHLVKLQAGLSLNGKIQQMSKHPHFEGCQMFSVSQLERIYKVFGLVHDNMSLRTKPAQTSSFVN